MDICSGWTCMPTTESLEKSDLLWFFDFLYLKVPWLMHVFEHPSISLSLSLFHFSAFTFLIVSQSLPLSVSLSLSLCLSLFNSPWLLTKYHSLLQSSCPIPFIHLIPNCVIATILALTLVNWQHLRDLLDKPNRQPRIIHLKTVLTNFWWWSFKIFKLFFFLSINHLGNLTKHWARTYISLFYFVVRAWWKLIFLTVWQAFST